MDYIRMIREKVGHECIFLNFAGGVVLNDQNQVLLQRRSDKNAWGFPGGALELGESAAEAALREIKEETGLDAAIEYLQGIYTKYMESYPNGDKAQCICFFFVCRITGGKLDDRNDETLELKFFDASELPPLVNAQHEDACKDFIASKREVYR